MPLTPDEEYLAKNCYGYGRWGADYWFIGLEEGQSKNGKDTTPARAEVWKELEALGKTDCGVCDIREFHNHRRLDEKWFKPKYPLQGTWRWLITWLKPEDSLDQIRDYQRHRWGSADKTIGETLLIELSGIPANGLHIPIEREAFRNLRTEKIVEQLRKHKPRFVVVYGKKQHPHWKDIANQLRGQVPTEFIFVESPTAYTAKGFSKEEYWRSAGKAATKSNPQAKNP
jgi:hypothetical protein